MEVILEKAKHHFEQNLPFVLYCKPNSDTIIGIFQQNDSLYTVTDFTEKGFVFASFDGSKTFLIPENESEVMKVDFQKKAMTFFEKEPNPTDETAKNQFENLVKKGLQAIENHEFKKVVLSRTETLDLVNFDSIAAFENLVQLYTNTFVYCFHHSKVGTWLGATPEQLVQANQSEFKTIALAGTQKDTGLNEVIWPKKEQEEQQFVTDYIVEKLKNVASELLVSQPYSFKAGSIWHIKTDISGTLNTSSSLKLVIQLLHPTPAVCGFPKDQSKAFILENEKYDRNFYTGFLGELNIGEKSDLFVNLRCMQKVDSKAHLFMGCGITKDSIPEKEWEESKNKAMTMKRIL
ncbi:isochorismate synthase [Flavobacterium nackdongense]|uniref:isochorismate synthase n=1 Tax=Flavobacterium nackdongense TaxID=2547394 RepID=A0A4P6Y5V2_9FLAO|nr:isochorismate synthase [Flavobacterium nackdongense]QBN17571.1 isochorismate synthase [Flavobacterium nackdongense]